MCALTTPTRPILRYHGGKWLLAPWIIDNMPPHRVYVEPFCGAASVLLRKPRSYAEVCGDISGEIVNVFRVARDHPEALEYKLRLTPFSRLEFENSYRSTDDCLEQARRTIVRAFMGFGSNAIVRSTGFRSNSNRSGTTPAADWRGYPDALHAIIERLQGVVLETRHAPDLMTGHDGVDTLHYVDPPYVHATRDGGRDYVNEMTDADHRDLAALLRGLSGMVMLSGYRNALYEDMLDGWLCLQRHTYADGARKRIEALWLNPAAQANLRQQDMFAVAGVG